MKLSQWTPLWKTAKKAVVSAFLIKAQSYISSHDDPIYISVGITSLVQHQADMGANPLIQALTTTVETE